jgi:cytoskeletal protein RodZ
MDFEQALEWANEFKPTPTITFSGPTILLVVAGIMISLLLIWWIVLIFSSPSKTSEEEFYQEDTENVEYIENQSE